MFRSNVTWSVVVFAAFCAFAGSAQAYQLWQCGNAATLAVSIHEMSRDPSPGTLQGPAAPHFLTEPVFALDCVMQGQDLGTEWVCTGANDTPVDLRVEVRRGRRTGDPWAEATVLMGERVVAAELPCTIKDVRDAP